MEQPLVSIIIPTYNRGDKILRSLESVVKQTYKNIEIIVIDDGSTDDTKNIVSKFIRKNSSYKINYIFHKNQGVSISRNVGIKASKGEYVCFLDSDDALYSNKIEKQIYKMISEKADLCIAETEVCYEDKNMYKVFRFPSKIVDLIEQYIKLNVFVHTSAYLVKKEVILLNKLTFREKCSWGEDVEFFIKVMTESRKICYLNEALHVYNFSKKESLSSFSWDKVDKDIFIWNEIQFYIDRKYSDKRRKTLQKIVREWRLPYVVLSKFYEGRSDRKYFEKNFWKYKKIYKNIRFANGIKSAKLIILFFVCILLFLIYRTLSFININENNLM